jgi:hypothetical protein
MARIERECVLDRESVYVYDIYSLGLNTITTSEQRRDVCIPIVSIRFVIN